MLTASEIERLVAACAGRPTLLTLTVVGAVRLDPPHPLDAAVAAAFDAHQRRTVGGRTPAGPDAADVAVTAFRDRGIAVEVRETPWRLGSDAARAGLVRRLARRRAGAGAEPVRAAQRRMCRGGWSSCAGRLTVSVGHRDLYAPGDT